MERLGKRMSQAKEQQLPSPSGQGAGYGRFRVFMYHLWPFLDYAGRGATETYSLWSVKDYLTLHR